jgi:arsenite methyltransferase
MKPEELKKIVKEKYGRIAEQNTEEKSCCGGTPCCGPEVDYTVFSEDYSKKEGYNPDADMNLGCGIPTDFAGIKQGDHVLDLGSGAGNDCFVARAIVGETGKVTGIDFTEPMIRKAKENCSKLGFTNVEFVPGDIEKMPFEKIFRVLKPGGHFCVSDVVIKGRLSEKMLKDAEMYAGCVSGASEMDEYLKIIENTGYLNVKTHKQKEIMLPDSLLSEYNDPHELNSYHAGDTGIFSITVSAYKPE